MRPYCQRQRLRCQMSFIGEHSSKTMTSIVLPRRAQKTAKATSLSTNDAPLAGASPFRQGKLNLYISTTSLFALRSAVMMAL